MSYTFQIDPTACFGEGKDVSKIGLIREQLFGKPLLKKGLRPSVRRNEEADALGASAASAVQPVSTAARQATSAFIKSALMKSALASSRLVSGEAGARKPVAGASRQRLPIEYKGHQISNAQQPDGNWIATFVRMDSGAELVCSSAAFTASSMALADARRQIDDAISLKDSAAARREFQRVPVSLKGIMFTANGAHDCQLLDLSAGGARLRYDDPAALAEELTLYVEGFGRYRASVINRQSMELSVRFVADDETVLSLLKGLSGYVKGYSPAPTKLRRDARVVAPIATVCRDAEGEAIACEIINASMRGMLIAMAQRPQIGALVTLGRTQMRVVRHHDLGIAVQQLSAPSAKMAGRFTFSN